MGVNNCMSVRQVRGVCPCPACPRAVPHTSQLPPQTLVLPQMPPAQEITPVKDKKASKMKVLKKIKKKIGLAPRVPPAGCAPNNLPPLSFHAVHGENIAISRDGSAAKRVESFCKGVAFSARPVRVNERVYLRFVEVSNSWSGALRFGFTTHDPASFPHPLPKYVCPDLTNKPGNWAKSLLERFGEKDHVLYYYVNAAGEVHYGVNGQDQGLFFAGVDTRSPLWALVDVYGNCTMVQFADPRSPYQTRRTDFVFDEDQLTNGVRALSLEEALPTPRMPNLMPLSLHWTVGRNVQISDRGAHRGIAMRKETEFCQGYVFTARPMRAGQTIVIQILATEPTYSGSLAIGLTSCDPATLRPGELPDDSELLLDRPEYWVLRRDAAYGLNRGDELAVTLTLDGEVRIGHNGSAPSTVMHVDHTLRLWAFVDLYGSTQKVRMLTSQQPPQPLRVATPLQTNPGGTVLVVNLPPQNATNAQTLTLASAHYIEPVQSSAQLCLPSVQMTPQSRMAQPATTAYNVPPAAYNVPPAAFNVPPAAYNVPPAAYNAPRPRPDLVQCQSTSQNNCNELVQMPNSDPSLRLMPSTSRQSHQSPSRQSHQSTHLQNIYTVEGLTGAECTICYENPIDSVLYMCGHMCMCYRCAVQQWRGKGGGQCPLCRAQIRDVIRTYKS